MQESGAKKYQRRDHIEEVGLLFDCLVETLTGSFSFRGDFAFDLRLCLSMALGLQRPFRSLCVFNHGSHSHHVDDLLFRGVERSGRRSDQSKI